MSDAIRHAATVLIVRDGDPGLEVYLLRRTKGMPFAGGMPLVRRSRYTSRPGSPSRTIRTVAAWRISVTGARP